MKPRMELTARWASWDHHFMSWIRKDKEESGFWLHPVPLGKPRILLHTKSLHWWVLITYIYWLILFLSSIEGPVRCNSRFEEWYCFGLLTMIWCQMVWSNFNVQSYVNSTKQSNKIHLQEIYFLVSEFEMIIKLRRNC